MAHYAYEYEPGGSVGDPSPVRLTCGTRGDPPIPSAIPLIAASVGLDLSPIDVHDADQTRWLEACVWPDLCYLSEQRQRDYVSALDRFGAVHDLSWVVIESPAQTPGLPIPSDNDDHATALSLVRWRSGARTVERLANCHPHGYWMHWNTDRS